MEKETSVRVVPLLWTASIESSIHFYKSLGFRIVELWTPKGSVEWCSMKFAESEIMLQQESDQQPDKPRQHSEGIELYFICSDVDELYSRFSAAGIEASAPKIAFYPMKQVFLKDPDDRLICFETPVTQND